MSRLQIPTYQIGSNMGRAFWSAAEPHPRADSQPEDGIALGKRRIEITQKRRELTFQHHQKVAGDF
jgi:hypothetical protein